MTKLEVIQKAIDFIEENLKVEFTIEEIVEASHFSQSHFMYLFQEAVGTSCMKYINRRKLLWALYEIKCGKKATYAALDYGYNTYAGFYKAFRREFGCTLSEYRKRYAIGKPHRLNLKQEGHLMVSNQKLKHILSHWGEAYGNIHPVKFSNGEIADDMWIVVKSEEVGKERFILYACTSEIFLKRCIELSKLERSEGLAAALPVPTMTGEEYVTDGDLCFYLTKKRRVIGELKNSVEFYRVPEQAQAVGMLLAKLHHSLKNAKPGEFYEEVDTLESIFERVPRVQAKLHLSETFCREFMETLARLAPVLPKQLIHRDPHDGNIILEDGKCAGFLHFELSRIHYRIFDLCYATTAVLCSLYMQNEDADRPADDIWLPVYHNIIKGYEKISPLSEEEKRALPYMVFSIQFICVDYFNEYDKFSRQARANEKMLLWLYENREELKI